MITCVTRKATSMKKQKSKKSRHESPFSGIVPVFLRMHQFQKFILRHFNTKQCLHHLKKYIMGFFLSVQTDHDDRQFIILFPLAALLFVSPYAVFTIAYFSPVCKQYSLYIMSKKSVKIYIVQTKKETLKRISLYLFSVCSL